MWKKPPLSTTSGKALTGLALLSILCGTAVAAWDYPVHPRWPQPGGSHLSAGWWRLYGLPQLQGAALNGAWQLGPDQVIIALQQFGWPTYRELGGTLGWTRQQERLTLGVALYLYRLQVERYSPRQGWNGGAILQYQADSSWCAAVTLANWLPSRCGEVSSTRCELALRATGWLQLRLQWLEYYPDRAGAVLGWRAGLPGKPGTRLEYSYDTRNGQSKVELCLRRGRTGWHIALLLHPQLGWSQYLQSDFWF
ncbi:MAG: hypothetical protein ISR91_03460 [Candidatus Delongbacteria bacterium]|nr:hypothetical protein [Candidatus Delongbacteria bacterium]